MMRLGIQKSGRLFSETVELLKKAGFSFNWHDRSLSARVKNFPLEILFLRAPDIPEMLVDSVLDLGIFGENTLAESRFCGQIRHQKRLGFGECRLVLAAPKNSSFREISDFAGKRIATSHPRLLEGFLLEKKVSADIIPMSGSVEIAPAMGIAEGICDLMSSGETLAVHNIAPLTEIFSSEAALVSTKEFSGGATFREFLLRLDSVLLAKNLKSVVMNAPRLALPEIEKILPGLDSPTITPLAREGWVAIHSVVSEDETFWEKISDLKKAGASGILIQPIDRVIF